MWILGLKGIIVTGMLLGKLNLIAVMETNVAVAQA